MQINIIEKYDRIRLTYAKGYAISFLIWLGLLIYSSNFPIENRLLKILVITIELSTGFIWVMYQLKLIKLSKRIKSDAILSDALNNEMYKFFGLKSMRTALFAFFISIILLIGLLLVVNIPALLICQVLLFIVLSALLISNLIYHYK